MMRAALLLLALVAPVWADDAPPPGGPRARVEAAERTFDAGKLDQGVPLKHTFVLKNVGDAELKVDAKPG
jgi:hypothetical protein